MNNLNKKEIIYSILILTIPLLVLFTTYFISKKEAETKKIVQEIEIEEQKETNVFDGVDIIAESAIVKDLNTGEVLYAKNPDISLPLASITKVLTVLTANKLLEKEGVIKITPEDLAAEGNSNLLVGENFNVDDLIDLTLAISSNDGAKALSSSVINSLKPKKQIDFIDEMNQFAEEIGMTRSRFYNETGLDENERRAGAYGSANDIATLFEYAIKNNKELFEATAKSNFIVRSYEGYIHNASNTNEIVDQLPNILAGKTGYTDIAGGNLAVVIDPFLNRPITIVVLGSTLEGRFEDVNKLSEEVINYFKNK